MKDREVKGKRRFVAGVFLPLIAVVALQVFVSYAGVVVLFCAQVHQYTGDDYHELMSQYMETATSADFNVLLLSVYAAVGILLLGLWYWKSGVHGSAMHAKRPLSEKPAALIGGVLLFSVGMQYLCDYLIGLLSMVFPSWLEEYDHLMEQVGLTSEVTAALVLYSVILAPICEELTFRGLTFGYGKTFMSFWKANIVQALLFAGFHMNPMQAVYAFVLGLFLGYFVEKSGRLWLSILIHITFNAAGVFGSAIAIDVNTPAMFFFLLFGSLVACYVGTGWIVRSLPAKTGEQQNAEMTELEM